MIRPVSPQVLACDALYLCAGLGAYTVKKHFDFSAWFQAFLGPALEALVSTMQTRARDVSCRSAAGCGSGVVLSWTVVYLQLHTGTFRRAFNRVGLVWVVDFC